ncbi:DIO1 [Branchiostoma lanceolatum]|uniref:Iodothyronine deiodinase n=1 Tax=Branchiostoma lanceolatum TaxID=7740 RepID=A0A8J9YXF3_BRALA|nr:DIO1 [Branchiostoma lanceolatum]
MANLAKFNDMVAEFADRADFLTVYIAEAHASDGWSFRNNIKIRKHRTLEERLAAAKMLADSNLSGPLLVDTMDDVANRKYGAWPERLYILLDGRVMYKGMMGPHGYHVHQVRDWLDKYLNNSVHFTFFK